MLKNKKAVYILIPLNIIIWGYFVFRFYAAYNLGDTIAKIDNDKSIIQKNKKDSIVYELSLEYKDPFLKENFKSKILTQSNNVVRENHMTKFAIKKVELIKNEKKSELDLKYMGLIKNTQSGVSVALVMINGQSKFVKPNDVIDDIKFKSFAQDCMLVINNKNKIVVHR